MSKPITNNIITVIIQIYSSHFTVKIQISQCILKFFSIKGHIFIVLKNFQNLFNISYCAVLELSEIIKSFHKLEFKLDLFPLFHDCLKITLSLILHVPPEVLKFWSITSVVLH